jgi:hypothetical protein
MGQYKCSRKNRWLHGEETVILMLKLYSAVQCPDVTIDFMTHNWLKRTAGQVDGVVSN